MAETPSAISVIIQGTTWAAMERPKLKAVIDDLGEPGFIILRQAIKEVLEVNVHHLLAEWRELAGSSHIGHAKTLMNIQCHELAGKVEEKLL